MAQRLVLPPRGACEGVNKKSRSRHTRSGTIEAENHQPYATVPDSWVGLTAASSTGWEALVPTGILLGAGAACRGIRMVSTPLAKAALI